MVSPGNGGDLDLGKFSPRKLPRDVLFLSPALPRRISQWMHRYEGHGQVTASRGFGQDDEEDDDEEGSSDEAEDAGAAESDWEQRTSGTVDPGGMYW